MTAARKKKKRARRRPKRRSWLISLTVWFIKCLLLVAIISILVVLPLRWINPPGSMMMVLQRMDAAGKADKAFHLRYRWKDWNQISDHLALAVMASEDQKFPFHHGFDLEAMADAVETRLAGGRLRGASTISQQVAKNLYLWPEKSFVRKGLEAYFTVLIEALLSKRRILEIYLNIAEFGPGLFGAEAASRHYYRKPAIDLHPLQAARLAAILPSPKRYNPRNPSKTVRLRTRWIQKQMRQLGGRKYLTALQ